MASFPPDLLRKYPHMFPEDIAIWERFLKVYKDDFLGFDYDVKVGSVPDFPDGLDNSIYKAGNILWKKRIDAVGYKKDGIYIIEVKPNAGMSALGQIITYRQLYIEEFNPNDKVFGAIVTDKPDLDLKRVADPQLIYIYAV